LDLRGEDLEHLHTPLINDVGGFLAGLATALLLLFGPALIP